MAFLGAIAFVIVQTAGFVFSAAFVVWDDEYEARSRRGKS
jgi:hypothetical protein